MRQSHTLLAAAALLLAPLTGFAQNAPAPTTNGPLVLERIHNDWVVAPDYKFTRLDDRTGQLAGGYVGRLLDGQVLIGGAGYWLANRSRDFELAYGGLLIGWQSPEMGRIRFGARSLIGGGQASLGVTFPMMGGPGPLPTGRTDVRFGASPTPVQTTTPVRGAPQPVQPQLPTRLRLIGRDDFVVVEPQATVSARVAGPFAISCGVGYRQTGGTDILRDRLNGVTANIAAQLTW